MPHRKLGPIAVHQKQTVHLRSGESVARIISDLQRLDPELRLDNECLTGYQQCLHFHPPVADSGPPGPSAEPADIS